MAIVLSDFDKIWASTSPLTPYSFTESNYKEGWNFIGATPPARQMWDSYFKWNDEKQQYIVQNFLPLSGGTMTGTIITSSETVIRKTTNDSISLYCSGTTYNAGSVLRLYGKAHDSIYAGSFLIFAADDNDSKYLLGKPDGTLQWGGVDILPVGVVQAYAGSSTPTGWLLCDGSAVSRTTYAKLFAVIGTTYGTGDGVDTFNLPNLVDKFVEGSATSGTTKAAGLPNITGKLNIRRLSDGTVIVADAASAFDINEGGGSSMERINIGTGTALSSAILYLNASFSNAIYGSSTTVQPPALTMRYIIKY